MPVRESTITTNIIKRLKKEPGLWCFKVHGGGMQEAGIPDILGSYMGRMFALEVKNGSGYQATPLQRHNMQKMANAGARVAVVESVEDALAVLGIS